MSNPSLADVVNHFVLQVEGFVKGGCFENKKYEISNNLLTAKNLAGNLNVDVDSLVKSSVSGILAHAKESFSLDWSEKCQAKGLAASQLAGARYILDEFKFELENSPELFLFLQEVEDGFAQKVAELAIRAEAHNKLVSVRPNHLQLADTVKELIKMARDGFENNPAKALQDINAAEAIAKGSLGIDIYKAESVASLHNELLRLNGRI